MLQRQYRFHGHATLRYLYAHGKTVRNRALAVRYAANPHRQDSRLAVVVTRKVLKAAPGRNRIRRRIYELLRTNWSQMRPGYDMVITVYEPRFADMPADELRTLVFEPFTQANLLQSEQRPS